MKRAFIRTLGAALLAAGLPASAAETLTHGRFADLQLLRPAGAPSSTAILLSDAAGIDPALLAIGESLADNGALVAVVSTPKMLAQFAKDPEKCIYAPGDLENLGRFVQAYAKAPGYRPPMLVGVGQGADVAYASLAQAPRGLFAGAVGLGLCAKFPTPEPFCQTEGMQGRSAPGGMELLPAKKLPAPFTALAGEDDAQCPPSSIERHGVSLTTMAGLARDWSDASWPAILGPLYAAAAADTRSAAVVPPAPNTLGDLPVVEVPVKGDTPAMAVLLSGDGGWAGIDKEVAAALAAKGIPVVGLDSLRYFWTRRTPESVGADLDRIVRYYMGKWRSWTVLLLGYSQGANVLPFAYNRMPVATRQKTRLVAMAGLSARAQFEFRLGNWIDDGGDGAATVPEVKNIRGPRVLCLFGDGDDDTACPQLLDAANVQVVKLPGGHHFGGDYARVAAEILRASGLE